MQQEDSSFPHFLNSDSFVCIIDSLSHRFEFLYFES